VRGFIKHTRCNARRLSLLHSLQFAAGFFGVQKFSTSYYQLIEIEASGFNTTLAAYDQCPNANNAIAGFGTTQATKWAAIYTPPIIQRLQQFISGVNLTATDIIAMQQTCAYEVSPSCERCLNRVPWLMT
jgi:hypothetical protein